MNLTTFLIDLGHVVAYYPKLNNITGSVNATIFLCQFLYWEGKQKNKQGWIYKTQAEIQEETGLSRREQETARRNLKTRGFLTEKLMTNPATLHYKLNLEAINNSWDKFINPGKIEEKPEETSLAVSAKQECTESSKQVWRIPPYLPYTETTTKITTLKKEEEEENEFHLEVEEFGKYVGLNISGEVQCNIYRKWRKDWKFEKGIIWKAGELAVIYCKNLNLQYIDNILHNWYKVEIKTIEQVEQEILKHNKQKTVKKPAKNSNYKQNKENWSENYTIFVPPKI